MNDATIEELMSTFEEQYSQIVNQTSNVELENVRKLHINRKLLLLNLIQKIN